MDPGDLIRWRGLIWLVCKVDRELATAIVEAERNMEVIPSDADSSGECQVWCKPAQQWPSAALPYRARSSRLVSVRHGGTELVRFQDWVKLDDFQIGGVIYLNPMLNLRFRDRLTAMFTDSIGNVMALPIDIPRHFSPLPLRRPPPPAPVPVVVIEPEPKTTPKLFARLRKRTPE